MPSGLTTILTGTSLMNNIPEMEPKQVIATNRFRSIEVVSKSSLDNPIPSR